jgi:hypothetical protein
VPELDPGSSDADIIGRHVSKPRHFDPLKGWAKCAVAI